MKYRNEIFKELEGFPSFDKSVVCRLGEKYGVTSSTINSYISKSLRLKEILSLKRGLYVTSAFYERHGTDASYKFYTANILRKPSYISTWSALQYYGLVTESIMSTTSVTTKTTRAYSNKLGGFIYNSLKKDLFHGYSLIEGEFQFIIATPSKALFDLIYFKTNQFRTRVSNIIDELRIDIGEMSRSERANFKKLIDQTNATWKIY